MARQGRKRCQATQAGLVCCASLLHLPACKTPLPAADSCPVVSWANPRLLARSAEGSCEVDDLQDSRLDARLAGRLSLSTLARCCAPRCPKLEALLAGEASLGPTTCCCDLWCANKPFSAGAPPWGSLPPEADASLPAAVADDPAGDWWSTGRSKTEGGNATCCWRAPAGDCCCLGCSKGATRLSNSRAEGIWVSKPCRGCSAAVSTIAGTAATKIQVEAWTSRLGTACLMQLHAPSESPKCMVPTSQCCVSNPRLLVSKGQGN